MKKFILFLAILFCSINLMASEPEVKIYLGDGSVKSYAINDIANINFIHEINSFLMTIYLNDDKKEEFGGSSIESLEFEFTTGSDIYLKINRISEPSESFDLIDIDSITFAFIPIPRITAITPQPAKIGDVLTITGENFGSTQGISKVTFPNVDASEYISWSDTQIEVRIPTGAKSGKIFLTVNSNKSNEFDFVLAETPAIVGINPNSFSVGDVVTIIGSKFGTSQGTSIVSFGGVPATEIVNWSDNQLQVKVPAGAVSGKLSVTVNLQKSNEVDYTVIQSPVITSINPPAFSIGQDIHIYGSSFGNNKAAGFVSFTGGNATVITSWADNEIVCKVPKTAYNGKLSVTVNSKKSNEVNYELVPFIDMVLLPAATFKMGNTGAYSSNQTMGEVVHNVTLTRSFYIGKFEVMQYQYQSVMGENQSKYKGDSLPVEMITWDKMLEFCNKLSEREGLTKCYSPGGVCDWNANGYRLPTEAEWEYACKASTTTDFYSGNLRYPLECEPIDDNIDKIGWYCGNADGKTHVVGQKEPNKFGLYDMTGNVWEWCWDYFGPFDENDATDPKGASSNKYKILRGGDWHNSPSMSRSSMRGMEQIGIQSSGEGFRVVRFE